MLNKEDEQRILENQHEPKNTPGRYSPYPRLMMEGLIQSRRL